MRTLALGALLMVLQTGLGGGRSEVTAPARPTYRTVRMNVSAYCPGACCCGKYADGITASGKPVTTNGGMFVAAPPNLAFGTMVQVPGYASGDRVPVLDRGGSIKGNRLDVFFPTHRAALEWGRQHLDVRIEE